MTPILKAGIRSSECRTIHKNFGLVALGHEPASEGPVVTSALQSHFRSRNIDLSPL
jgi:hypothetical protein